MHEKAFYVPFTVLRTWRHHVFFILDESLNPIIQLSSKPICTFSYVHFVFMLHIQVLILRYQIFTYEFSVKLYT